MVMQLPHLGMDQYLLIPFLVGWTSIYQLFWCSPGVQGFDTLPLHNCLSAWLQGYFPTASLGPIPASRWQRNFIWMTFQPLQHLSCSYQNEWVGCLEISPSGGQWTSSFQISRTSGTGEVSVPNHRDGPAPAPPVLVSGFYSASLDFTTVISPVFMGFSCCRLWFKNFPPKLPQNSWKSSQRNINFALPDASTRFFSNFGIQ